MDRWKGVCERVWDGDTIEVQGRRIRLAYIDAPEIEQRSRWGVPVGRESAHFLRKLVGKKWVDVQLLGRDFYRRWLGRVWVVRDGVRVDVNVEMVLQGQAFPFAYRVKSPGLLNSAKEVAKLRGRGFWQYQGVQLPWNYRRRKR